MWRARSRTCSVRPPKPRRWLPRPAAVLLLASTALLSCSGQSRKEPFPLAELKKSTEARNAQSGTIKLTTRDAKGRNVTAPGVLLVEWPDKIRLEVQDPVGSLLALLVIRGDRFWLYQQNRKENLTGPVERIPAGISFPFRSEDLVRALLARPDLERFGGSVVSGSSATAGEGKGRETLRWSGRHQPEEWTLERDREPRTSVTYEDYESRSGILFPTKVRLSRGPEDKPDRSVLLVWTDWEPSVPGEKKLFQIPQQQQFGRPTKALP